MALPGTARSAAVLLAIVLAAGCGGPPAPGSPPAAVATLDGAASASAADPVPPSGSPVPAAGHELYGFVPYWEMDDTIAAHVGRTPLTTLALFSVTTTARGTLDTAQEGYRRITGRVGTALIAAAHQRGAHVELVFTSFGAARNASFFGSAPRQAAAVRSLVALVGTLDVDGVGVDVEGIDVALAPAYGAFVAQVRSALTAAHPGATVTVATGPGPTGVAMAAAALAAGADRVFLMGYDYRTPGSPPGATSPLERADGGRSLTWSLDLYGAAGIPPGRLLLGLPLYGVAWPVAGPVIGAPATGDGAVWILRRHLDVLASPAAVPQTDPVEAVDVYFEGSDGGAASAPATAPGSPAAPGAAWTAVYVDSPTTLAAKLALGESRGLAGAGFWAIGYERGLPAYTALMGQFVAGAIPVP